MGVWDVGLADGRSCRLSLTQRPSGGWRQVEPLTCAKIDSGLQHAKLWRISGMEVHVAGADGRTLAAFTQSTIDRLSPSDSHKQFGEMRRASDF